MKRISSKGSLDALRALPLFSALPEEEFADLVSRCVRQRHAGGEEIFAPGDEADRFFVILSGTVKVFQLSAKGDEQILHLYGAGQTFGEAAMWSQVPYPAYAIALDETWLLVVSRAELQSFIEHRPELAMAMLAEPANECGESAPRKAPFSCARPLLVSYGHAARVFQL